MITDIETPINLDGRDFAGIQMLGVSDTGHFIIALWTTPAPEPRGSYFSSIPISPTAYRREHPTRAGFIYEAVGSLVIFDDWNSPHRIRTDDDIIRALIVDCEQHEICSASQRQGNDHG